MRPSNLADTGSSAAPIIISEICISADVIILDTQGEDTGVHAKITGKNGTGMQTSICPSKAGSINALQSDT